MTKVKIECFRYFKCENKLTPGKDYPVCKCLFELYEL